MFETGKGIDWATAEALAIGSLLLEGTHVRLSGQDVERGTFSHRHAVLHDQTSNTKFVPLNSLTEKQEFFEVTNTSLSEFAVLGFELGYSLENPNSLVMWEAQFGDFVNGAQIVIDTFISCAEQKWQRQNGLVMLLPHGYEGQGPEHSSARLERFLQMSDSNPNVIPNMERHARKQIQESNWQIVNCTTPANYFHALRRQIHRGFRKPLVVMSPKSLLRHRLAVSNLDEFDDKDVDTRFKRVIGEIEPQLINSPERVERLIFCSGKVYYDLLEERRAKKYTNSALVRVEQISPFPFDRVVEQAKLYPNAKIIWAQEEPMNMGSWSFVYFNFKTAVPDRLPKYAGREPSAAPSTGLYKLHELQVRQLFEDAFVRG
jgi:2-oxoglutarate dehydrogenase E1 component